MPPWWVRRLLLAPAVVVLSVVLVVTAPLWLLVALLLAPVVPGRLRPVRVLWIGFVYLLIEAAALITMVVYWVASGFGWKLPSPAFQRAHYRLTGRLLRLLFWQGRWALRTRIVIEGYDPDALGADRPLIVLCRHAGPGDSFIVAHALINWYSREPRIVLKDTLQWDPAVDVLLHRLPSRFIAPGHGEEAERQVAALAAGLDANDALVIFPEGGNFTPERWHRAIDRLRRMGLEGMARRAEAMTHVLAPRPGGVLAALDVARDADVVLVAHTGLDHLLTVGDVWREIPTDKTITMRWWREPVGALPAGRQGRIEWLYDWWARIDEWIERNRP
ncbi:MAG TPA: 1-acyl-sn-glycerol-3-phosphate acyltransferase [Micromonosporaceae bacterium]